MFRYFFCLLLLFLPQVSFAEVRLAVLEFRGTGLGESGLRILSDKVREGVLSVSQGKVNGQKLIIMTRENMMQVLKDQGLSAEDCTGACEVEVAKNIGADYVISGEVSMFDGLYIVTIKLHQTSNSNLMGTQTIETEKKRELLSEVKTVGANIFRDGLNITRPSQSKNAIQKTPSSQEEKREQQTKGPKVKLKGKIKINKVRSKTGVCDKDFKTEEKKRSSYIRYCYDKELKKKKIEGKITISLRVKKGTVQKVSLQSSVQSSSLESCIKQELQKWRLPPTCNDKLSTSFVLTEK